MEALNWESRETKAAGGLWAQFQERASHTERASYGDMQRVSLWSSAEDRAGGVCVCVCTYVYMCVQTKARKNCLKRLEGTTFRVHTGPVPLPTSQNREPHNSWSVKKNTHKGFASVAGQNKP